MGWKADATPGDYHYVDAKGRCCSYPFADEGQTPGADYIVVGKNEPLEANSWNLDKQGGALGDTLNVVPGIDATAHLHDRWWNSWVKDGVPFNNITNYGTMLPSAAITYGAAIGNFTRDWYNNQVIWSSVARSNYE